jgi:hypothetical protein
MNQLTPAWQKEYQIKSWKTSSVNIKTLTTLIMLKLLAMTWCVIEGDKNFPSAWREIPCGTVLIDKPWCRMVDNKTMKINFKVHQDVNPELCDTLVPLDVHMYIQGANQLPIAYREVRWTHRQTWASVIFSSTQNVRQEIVWLNNYDFSGHISYTHPLQNNTLPAPELTVTTHETHQTYAPWVQLWSDDYQFPCEYKIVTPPCDTKYTAYCHSVAWAPEDGIASYRFNVCNPMSMCVCFGVTGPGNFWLKWGSKVRYALINGAGNVVYTTEASPWVNTPISFAQWNNQYTLQVTYRGNKAIPLNGHTTLHIPNIAANSTANIEFWTALTWSVNDIDCSN